MKIICDNEEEYKQVLEGCQYIHDYSVELNGVSKKTKVRIIKKWGRVNPPEKSVVENIRPEKGSRWLMFSLDFEEYPFINFLAHGIADCSEDIRKKFIEIKRT